MKRTTWKALLRDPLFLVSGPLLVLSVVMIYRTRVQEPLRPSIPEDPRRIELRTPAFEVGAGELAFAWTAAEGASHYRVEVFTPDLQAVLERDRVAACELRPAPEETERLRPGVEYSWWVQARGPDGRTVAASRRGLFRLRGAGP
jgi:hypothetical protein